MSAYSDKINTLKEQIESVFQRKIETHSDCIQLQHQIFLTTEKKIALSSIRRLFHPSTYTGKFSSYTLEILTEYVEWNQLHPQPIQDIFTIEWLLKILQESPRNEIANPYIIQFIHSFYEIQLSQKTNDLTPVILRKIAKAELGRRIFFDQFVYLDQLNQSYGKGMEYYLQYEKVPEHRAFAMTILSIRDFLTGNIEKSAEWLDKLLPYPNEYHPFIQGRIRGLQILHHQWPSSLDEFTQQVMIDTQSHVFAIPNYRGFPAYEFMIFEALWRTQDEEKGAWLAEFTYQKWQPHWNGSQSMDLGYYHVLKQFMLHFTLENKTLHRKIIHLHCASNFPPLVKNYYKKLLSQRF